MNIIKQKNEKDFEYKVRLCIAKLNKEIDLDWFEMVNLLHLDCSADHLRKLSYGYKEYHDFIQENPNVTNNKAILKEIEDKTIELEKEKIKLYDQKREYRKLIREMARWEHLEEVVKESVLELEQHKPLFNVYSDSYRYTGRNELVVMLSDWHYGLECDNFWNTFNESVFNLRIEKLLHKIIEIGERHNTATLNIFALGDMVNGLIHTTTRIFNSEDVIAQSKVVAETLSYICEYLSPYFEKINFYNSNGNHDRVVANKNDNLDEESFSYLITWFMKARLRESKKVKIHENIYDKGIIVTDICGHTFIGVHGDKDKPASSTYKLPNILGIKPKFMLMGHYHSNFEKNESGIDIIVNGSLSGVDSYAKERRLVSQPMQKIMVINQLGRECTYNVEL